LLIHIKLSAAAVAAMVVAASPATALASAAQGTQDVRSTRAGIAIQQSKLIGSDSAPGDNFGYSVATYGSTAVVGAPAHQLADGAAYVFVRSGTAWAQQATLTAPVARQGAYFGFSVAIYGSTAVVGAPLRSSPTGGPHSGAAYVFTRSGTRWSEQARLTASDAAPGALFGESVGISGSTIVVGAPEPANWRNPGPGAAYVFMRSGTHWSQTAKLTASTPAIRDDFGRSVGISGSSVIVGADGKTDSAGAAYVFTRSGTTWSQQATLTAPHAASDTYFGYAVALSGSTAVAGAPGQNAGTGAAYVFTRSGTTWSQQATLTAPHAASDTYFGYAVALSGSTAVAGAPGQNAGTGAAYVFTRSGTTWPRRTVLTASHAIKSGGFGNGTAIVGTTAVVGAPYHINAAYAFTGV
jgi:hypothetical protein